MEGTVGAKRRISSLEVHFISLVGRAANRRTFLTKAAEAAGLEVIEKEIVIRKQDVPRRMVFGIVYAPDEVDTEGDTISREEIAEAAYRFMQNRRTTAVDTDHDGETGKGFVAESWIVRKGDPVFPEEPEGAWAVGIKITDEETWNRVQSGELQGLSLAGVARAEAVDEGKNARGEVAKGNVEILCGDDVSMAGDETRGSGGMICGDEVPRNRDEITGASDETDFVDSEDRSVSRGEERVDGGGAAEGQVGCGYKQPAGQAEGGAARQLVAKIRHLLGIGEDEEKTGTTHERQKEMDRRVLGGTGSVQPLPFLPGSRWTQSGMVCPDRREARLEKTGPLPIEKTVSAEEIVEHFSKWLHLAMGVKDVERRDPQHPEEHGLQFIARTSVEERISGTPAALQTDPHAVPEEATPPVEQASGVTPVEDLAARIVKVAEAITELARRIEQLEKSTTGRQTLLGGEDMNRGLEKGYKGVRIL